MRRPNIKISAILNLSSTVFTYSENGVEHYFYPVSPIRKVKFVWTCIFYTVLIMFGFMAGPNTFPQHGMLIYLSIVFGFILINGIGQYLLLKFCNYEEISEEEASRISPAVAARTSASSTKEDTESISSPEISAEQRELEELYKKYERQYIERSGGSYSDGIDSSSVLNIDDPQDNTPSLKDLKIKKDARYYIPGTFEFNTDDPEWRLVVPHYQQKVINVIYLLLTGSIFFAMLLPTMGLFVLYMFFVFVVSFPIQFLIMKYLEKKDLLEVKRWGDTPATRGRKRK